MQLDLDIPESLVRKLKALNILEGGMHATSMESLVVAMMDEVVNYRILEIMNAPASDTPYEEAPAPRVKPTPKQVRHVGRYEDTTGISDGLGDDDEDGMPPPETDEMALVPRGVGMTDDDLEDDMKVEDPDHEAKEEAPEFPAGVAADDIFSKVVGIARPLEDDDEIDHRIAKRKKRLKIKGKVKPMTEEYDSSSF